MQMLSHNHEPFLRVHDLPCFLPTYVFNFRPNLVAIAMAALVLAPMSLVV